MGWFPHIHTQFHVLGATLDTTSCLWFSVTGLSPSAVPAFHLIYHLTSNIPYVVLTPIGLLLMVWAVPLSLATTDGITIVFSSYGYLDVSVPHVSLV